MYQDALLKHWLDQSPLARRSAGGLALTLAYILLSLLGHAMAVPPGYASAFWPAAGVAVAGCLLLGRSAWPWVFLGSILANAGEASSQDNVVLNIIIASGAALECWLAATLTRRYFTRAMLLSTEGSVWSFLFYAAIIPTTLTASITTAGILGLDLINWQQVPFEWLSWWAGDAVGIAMVCPLVLFLFSRVRITSRFFAIHVVPVAFMLLFISFGHLALNHHQREELNDASRTFAENIQKEFSRSISEMLLPLEFTANFITSSNFVSREEFHHFIVNSRYKNAFSALGWAPRITADERSGFEESHGLTILSLHENGRTSTEQERAYYYPSLYIYPEQAAAELQGLNILSTCFDPYPVDDAIKRGDILLVPPTRRRCSQQDVIYAIKPVHRSTQENALGVLVGIYNLKSAMSDTLTQIRENNLELIISTTAPDDRVTEMLSTLSQNTVEIAFSEHAIGGNTFSIRLLADSLYWQAGVSPINYLYTLFTIISAFSIAGAVMGSANRQVMKDREIRQRTLSLTAELQAREQAERQLTATTTLLSSAIDMANMGVWEIDFNRHRFLLGDGMMAMLGEKTDSGQKTAIAIDDFIAQYFPAEDAQLAYNIFSNPDNTRLHYYLEHRLIGSDGNVRTVQSQCHVERDADNHPLRALGISLDVSHFRENEAAMRKARDEAEAANHAKSQFLARMSHEIRTPMNGVIGMLELLQQEKLTPKQLTSVGIARSSADSLMHIIDNILDFSKIEADGLTLENVEFDPRHTLAEVLDLMTPVAADKGVQLHCYASLDVPHTVSGDPFRLRQVLLNLIGNAIKYSAKPESPGVVQILLSCADKLLRFEIIDNGIGIAKDVLPRLFTPFTQADESTTRLFGGTGLGLAISRELVELMGGSIVANSTPGQRTCFTIRLPMQHADTPSPAPLQQDVLLFGIADDCAMAIDKDVRKAGGSCQIIYSANDRPSLAGDRPVILLMHSEAATLSSAQSKKLCTDVTVTAWISVGGDSAARLSRQHIAVGNAVLSLDYITAISAQLNRDKPRQAPATPAGDASPARALSAPIARLLVAEDSEINQQVIAQQLERLGYVADYASNGEQALALWQQREYPLLITDLHMPEFDGYSLARAIRRREPQLARRRTPIIALSANVIFGEDAKCRAAGIDTFLTKPTSISALSRCIAEHLGTAPNDCTAVDTPVDGTHDAVLDLNIFKNYTGGSDELAAEFVELFKQTLAEAERQLEELLGRGDANAIVTFAHTMKSSAKAIGAQQLAQLCDDMEQHYGESPHSDGQLIEQWRSCLAKLKPALTRELAQSN